jgi:hypothetical protein
VLGLKGEIREVDAHVDFVRVGKQVSHASLLIDGLVGWLGRRLTREIREEETRLANDALSRQAESLDAQAGIAVGLDARHDLERRALALQQQIERNLLEQDIATGRIADAEAARADLAVAQVSRRTAVDQRNETPLEQRRREVRETAADMRSAVEDIHSDAIDRLTNGLADASTEYLKLGGIAGDVLNGIIRNMVRLAARQAIFGSAGLGSIGGFLGIGGGSPAGAGLQ